MVEAGGLVAVHSTHDRTKAELVKTYLAQDGIAAAISDDLPAGSVGLPAFPVRILISPSDCGRAEALIQAITDQIMAEVK